MNKDIKKLLTVLILFSLAVGLFGNFEEFWMQGTGLSLKTISIVLSLASLISCSVIFLCVNWIKPNRLKIFAETLLFTNAIVDFILYLLYGTKFLIPLKFFVMVDYAISVEILVVIYPLMTFIKKSDKLYAIKDLLYAGSYYLGVIIGIFFIKKAFLGISITYNSYLLISSLLMAISGVIMTKVNIKVSDSKSDNLLSTVVNKVMHDKISKNYLAFSFFGTTAYNVIVGVLLLLLVQNLNYTETTASTIRLALGISAPVIGAIILSKFTFKNNYLNIGIKYIIRCLVYLLPIFYLSKFTILLAILYTELTSYSYVNVTDAPYINRFSAKEQFAFSNLKDIIGYLAKSFGIFLCGYCMVINVKYNFLVAACLFIIAIIFAYKALYDYNNEVSGDNHDRK